MNQILKFKGLFLIGLLFTIAGFLISCSEDTEKFPPTITSIAPTSGFPGDTVTVVGTNFIEIEEVFFNEASGSVVSDSLTELKVIIPQGATTGQILVRTKDGEFLSDLVFEVLNSPSITSFSPTSAEIGEEVIIIGTSLTGASEVLFGDVTAVITSNTENEIRVTVPENAMTGKISIVNSLGTAISSSDFTIIIPPIPIVATVSPRSGVYGDDITISGSNLADVTIVTLGFANASIKSQSATSLVFTIPDDMRIGQSDITLESDKATGESGSDINFFVVKTEPTLRMTFDGEYDGVYAGSKDLEENTFYGQSNEVPGAQFLPSPIDNNFFHMEGYSSKGLAGSYISQVSTPTKDAGFYSSFIGDISADELYINLQVHVGELPTDYGTSDDEFVMSLRFRFEGGDYIFFIDLNELNAFSDGPDANGWYSSSFPASQFVDKESLGTFNFSDVQRVAVVARRAYGEGGTLDVELDGTEGSVAHSLSFDNLVVTVGGPYSF